MDDVANKRLNAIYKSGIGYLDGLNEFMGLVDPRLPVASVKYHVIDKVTGVTVSICSTRKRARTKLDKHDNAYGSYRYKVVEVVNGKIIKSIM